MKVQSHNRERRTGLHQRVVVCCALAAIAWTQAPAPAAPTTLPVLQDSTPETTVGIESNSPVTVVKTEPDFLAENLVQTTIWQHPALSTESRAPRSLPGAPGAIFMGLLGLALVISIRERKGIIAVCAGLLLAGQVGISSLPRLTSRLIKGKLHTAQLTAQRIDALFIHDIFTPSDIAIRRYIGLLHRISESSARDASHPLALIQKVSERHAVAAQGVYTVPAAAMGPLRAVLVCNHRSLRRQCDIVKPMLAAFLPHLASRAPPASC